MEDENMFEQINRQKREREAAHNLGIMLGPLFRSKAFWIVIAVLVGMRMLDFFI